MDDQNRNVALIINNLRIRRLDDKNIVLERLAKPNKPGKKANCWKVYGYYHTLDDLADVLSGLLISIPPDSNLAVQIVLLRENIAQARNTIIDAINSVHTAPNRLQGQIDEDSE